MSDYKLNWEKNQMTRNFDKKDMKHLDWARDDEYWAIKLLNDLDDYFEKNDFIKIINKYRVKAEVVSQNRPGKDDLFWVDVCSTTLGHAPTQYLRLDKYLNDLLPKVKITTQYDKGWCRFDEVAEEYDCSNEIHLAINMEREIKERALLLYDKDEHRAELRKYLKFIIEENTKVKIEYVTKNLEYDSGYGE